MEEMIRKIYKPVLITWIVSALCYLPFIAKGLTNSVDGLWASTYYQAGNIELGSGRWALLFLDKARLGYGAEPFSTLLALLFLSMAAYISISMFMDIRKSNYVYAMLITCCTSTCCILAYRFTSANYCLGVLLSVLSVYCVLKESDEKKVRIRNTLIAIAILVFSTGIYQVDLGVFAVLVILNMMKLIYKEDNRNCFRVFKVSAVVFVVSCILYKIAWNVCMMARHISASSYNGADSVSIFGMLSGIPSGLCVIYKAWSDYFSFTQGNYVLAPIRAFVAFVLFIALFVVGVRKLAKQPKNAIIYGILWVLLPVAANIAIILAPSMKTVMMQMTVPMAFALPLAMCFLDEIGIIRKWTISALGIILLYGNIFAVGADIDAMAQGSNSSNMIMNNIAVTLNQKQLLSDDYDYAFFGNISANELFKKNELYDMASPYAKFGTMQTKPDMVHKSYIGLLDDIGLDLEIVDNEKYLELYDSGILDNMPAYPEEGSIIEKDGVVIVKVSDDYIFVK